MMKIRDVDLAASRAYPKARDFNRSTQWLASLYVSCLGELEAGSISKVFIEVAPTERRIQVRKIGNVAEVLTSSDLSAYWSAPVAGKKRMALDLLEHGLLAAASHFGWPKRPFEAARDCIVQKGYRNAQFWDRARWNPDRTFRAQVFYDFDVEEITVWAIVWNREGDEVAREQLVQLPPSDPVLVGSLGRFRWRDLATCELTDRKGESSWTASVRVH